MLDKELLESVKNILKALGISKNDLIAIMDDEDTSTTNDDDDDDVTSFLVNKPAEKSFKLKKSPQATITHSTGMLEQLKHVGAWDINTYKGKISQVMKDGETPVFDEANDLTTPNTIDSMVDDSLIADDDDDIRIR